MGNVFDDVKAIEGIVAVAAAKRAQAEALLDWEKIALDAHARLVAEVNADASALPRAAEEARGLLNTWVTSPPADTPKRGRGPERQPRRRKGGASEVLETVQGPTLDEIGGPPRVSQQETDGAVLLHTLANGPLTVAGIQAITGWTQARLRDVVDADPQFTTWSMQREGDSEPVTVWGTTAQRDAYVNSIPIQTRAKVPNASK